MSFEPHDWWTAMKNLPPELLGPVIAFVMAVIRVIYDQSEDIWWRILLEGLICSGLAVGASSAVKALELNVNWIIAISSLIGFIGTIALRVLMVRFLNTKLGSK